jgi:predicted O-methyltransferase YrrM
MSDCPVELLQDESEIDQLIRDFYIPLKPRQVLEIGSLYGGSLWYWIQNSERGTKIVSVDKIPNNELHKMIDVLEARQLWDGWANRAGVFLQKITGNSNNYEVREWVQTSAPFDFIFIDGGHDIKTVNNDWNLYYPMLKDGGVIAFHDIAYGGENKHCIEVGKWWQQMKDAGLFGDDVTEIIRTPEKWGIGVIRK